MPEESFVARSTADLAPFRERLLDQEFDLANLRHETKERAVDLVVRKVFPPHKGVWAVRISRVRSWRKDHGKNHTSETLKEILLEGRPDTGYRVVLRCVLDRYEIEVDSHDLRIVRTDADDPAKVSFNQLPAWFRAEIQEKHNEADREERRIVEVGTRVRARAAAGGALLPFLIGLVTGGGFFALLLGTAPASGLLQYVLSGSKVGRYPKGILYGVGSTAACFAAGGVAGTFFTPLLLVCTGILLQMWVEQMRDMEV